MGYLMAAEAASLRNVRCQR